MTDETEGKPKRVRKAKQWSVSLHPGDRELIEWGAQFLGSSSSDFVRSAIRAYAMSLEMIERSRTRSRG